MQARASANDAMPKLYSIDPWTNWLFVKNLKFEILLI